MNVQKRRSLIVHRYRQQNGRCIWCGGKTWCRALHSKPDARSMFLIQPGLPGAQRLLRSKAATLEHVIPLSLGGSNVRRNIVMACHCCNTARASDISRRAPHPEVVQLIDKKAREHLIEVVQGANANLDIRD